MTAAIDTNILVRFLTGDDLRQADIATDHIRQGFILLPTVAMETEWVLRASYDWPREQIAAAFRNIIDMPEAIDVPVNILWVLERFAAGADFADMMHIAAAGQADKFVTFDQRIDRSVGNSSPVAVMTLT